MSSLLAKGATGGSVQVAKGAGMGARRFVAIGNLLGYQTKSLFPTTTGRNYEKTTLLEPLWDIRDKMTVLRGLDHGVKGGHFAVHSFLSGVLHSEAQNRPDGNVTIDQFLADEVGFETRFPSLTVGSEGGIHGGGIADPFDFPALRKHCQSAYMANLSYDKARGNAAIASGHADAIAYGVPFIANPDLVERFSINAALNEADSSTFYGGNEHGYTDYPFLGA